MSSDHKNRAEERFDKPEDVYVFCPGCGTQLPRLARFCPMCGRDVLSLVTERDNSIERSKWHDWLHKNILAMLWMVGAVCIGLAFIVPQSGSGTFLRDVLLILGMGTFVSHFVLKGLWVWSGK